MSRLSEILKLSSIEAAPLLLGWNIVRQTPEGKIIAKIVETEAYHQDDPASHSFRGLTARTAPMFEAGGTIYVYFTYGMHYCMNIVTGPARRGEAVLVRAAQPVEGVEIMKTNRGINDFKNLTNGPGKLTQALGIKSTDLSGKKLNKSTIYLEPPIEKVNRGNIVVGPRIGINKAVEVDGRFYIRGNMFVSKP